ncbi:hypothetical protein GCM10010236_08550 [Streptomyces eurythermus]|nr:hypothetical protein GCM10010236_08550 [Streptomyces eurythermus]
MSSDAPPDDVLHAVRLLRPVAPGGRLPPLHVSSADTMPAHIVAADCLDTLLFMEEVSARLG